MKKLRERTLWFITTTSIFMVVMVCVVLYNQRVFMIRQEQEIAELNQEIGEYRMNEAWFEDYVDVLEEIYKGRTNEAVLEERIYWINKINDIFTDNSLGVIYNEEYVDQMLDDLDDLIEIIIFYYEETDQVVDLETYIKTNYPALYDRIMKY